MPATDINLIYDYETAIESAVLSALDGAGINTSIQRGATSMVTPFASLQMSVGSGIEHYHTFISKEKRPDIFTGVIAIQVATNRTQNDANHGTDLAVVRELMYRWRETINPNLLYHKLLHLLEGGTALTVDEEKNLDISTINFAVQFAIRTDAWPVEYLQ